MALKGSRPQAVIVHSDSAQATTLAEWLEADGVVVRIFQGAADALEGMEEAGAPDILVASLRLPEMDGWKLTRLMRSAEFESLNRVPIVLLSPTFVEGRVPLDPGSLGVDALLPHSVEREDFLATTGSLLSGKPVRPPLRVLIVEDQELLATVLRQSFQDHGDWAEVAGTLEEGSRLLRSGAYDLAILDYHLPDGLGDALLEEIRREQSGCVAVMVTGDPSAELSVDWMRRGASAYVRKPFKVAYLRGVVAQAMRERALLDMEKALVEQTGEMEATRTRLQRIADHAPVTFFVFQMEADGSFSFPFISGQVERFTPYSAREVMADPSLLIDIIHPEDRERFQASIRESASELSPYQIELRWMIEGEELRWMEAYSTPEATPEGGVRWYGVLNDVTPRKEAEEALKEQAHLLAESQRVARLGSYVFDVEAGLWTGSEVLDQIFGIEGTDRPRTAEFWLEIVHPDDREEMARYLQEEVLGKGTPFNREYRVQRLEDGEVRWVHGRGELVRGPQGEVWKLLGTIQDVTDEREAREALESRNQFIESVTSLSPDILYIYDLVEKRNVYSNDRIETLLGFDGAEILEFGKEVLPELLHPDDFQVYLEEILPRYSEVQDGEVVSHQYRMRHRDGRWVWVEAQEIVFAREADGSPRQILGVARDVTERKAVEAEKEALQAQFVQAQKMESVGRLAGGVAHDFNNMLGVILGRTEMALGHADPSTPLHEDLMEIQAAGERSADLTRQLLAFARLQTALPEVLDLNETAHGMLKMLQRIIGEDIDLVWAPGPDLWEVRMDAAQVDQILANLCVNARDSIDGVGKITIETRNATFDEAFCAENPEFLPGDFVLLAVSDDGCGMDVEILDHVFEPFFTTKDVGHGTGLGLATVYGIVSQNDGFITVETELGRGTTFELYLPRAEGVGAEPASRPTSSSVPQGQGETVLLVEDEGPIRDVARSMLENLGYLVVSAATPSEAIERARAGAGSIDLLLTDVIMPEMNGRDLALRLRESFPELKVLFMSGYTADVIAHHGVLDHEVLFLQKPFSRRDLGLKLKKVLEGPVSSIPGPDS